GVWQGLVPDAAPGMLYKYRVVGLRGEVMDRADPCAQGTELPPQTASRIVALAHAWNDAAWLAARAQRQGPGAPISVYEVHLGSWLRDAAGDFLTYGEIAPKLVAHVQALGFTHVELMPITEHPFYGSWGYQTSAYFAPTARHGGPEGLMQLIDALHQADIGVILDWVPGHFPADAHGLARFDGTALYEHQDPRRGVHPDWNTLIFNFGRHEVRAFLLSSAMMWIERYHIDGIRVDAVASMLYLDYSRQHGQWLPNERGGRENLEAVAFLRALNAAIHREHPDVITIAEESTSWPQVTGAIEAGGLGFDYKWDMGWMHDTLRYLGRDPIVRQYHHNELTFRMWYAYKERYMLPLSHDEVVHGKYSLIRKMHGSEPARFASLRLLLAYMFTTPGRKLLFMGGEFGQLREWNHDRQLDWELREQPLHAGLERWVARLARLYREVPALHEQDDEPSGYQWLIVDDHLRSLAVYLRFPTRGPVVMIALNFTPVTWVDHAIGVPAEGTWTVVDRSDAHTYSDVEPEAQPASFAASETPAQNLPFSLRVTLPPLTALVLAGPEVAELRAAAERHRVARIAREAEAVRAAEAAAAEAARVAEVAREAQAAAEAEAAEAARVAAEAEAAAAETVAAGIASEKGVRVEEAGRSAADAARRNDPPGSTNER
ncbi:MAG TPA: 1,4-alpha-glucan branching protein GlgB, partial [Nannocystis sp.]